MADFIATASATPVPSTKGEARSWLIVSQYKSDRVVYFTDDPEFDIPASADWCYVSPYLGALPDGMSLRNCWGWRYRGMAFIDARKAPAPNPAQALLDLNKDALRKLLREKIDLLRKPVMPSAAMGAVLREAKLAEAHAVLAGNGAAQALRLLPTAAAARNITLQEMARLVIDRHQVTEQLLMSSELLREEIAVGIEQAVTQDTLSDLRNRLLEELAPEATATAALRPEHTTPQKHGDLPTADELAQEQLRLRVQLRVKINELRRGHVSDYLLDDVVLRHKGRIAEAVMKAGGALPPGLDGAPLISHAAARGQTLVDAARDVLTEMSESARVLLATEQMKEALLARLAGAATFADIKALGRAIDKLSLKAVDERAAT
jgi:hypothetical protein